jgi:hypothetical protein
MKRIAGSFLLLAGLSGCLSVTISPKLLEPTTSEVKSPPPVTQAMASPAGPDPTYAHWQPDPGHFQNGSVVDTKTTRATPPSQLAALPDGLVASAAPLVQPLPPAPRPATCRLGDMPSLLPVVVTPPRETEVVQTSCVAPQETWSEKIANDMPDTQAQRWCPVLREGEAPAPREGEAPAEPSASACVSGRSLCIRHVGVFFLRTRCPPTEECVLPSRNAITLSASVPSSASSSSDQSGP